MGGPVHYVRNAPKEFLVSNHIWILEWMESLTESSPKKQDAINYFAMLLAYLKGMSDFGSETFNRLDEHEWRIVFLHDVLANATKKVSNIEAPYVLCLAPDDVSCVVFPDAATRRRAFAGHAVGGILRRTDCPFLALEELPHC